MKASILKRQLGRAQKHLEILRRQSERPGMRKLGKRWLQAWTNLSTSLAELRKSVASSMYPPLLTGDAQNTAPEHYCRLRLRPQRVSFGGLIPRQRRVLQLVAEGCTNKEIAGTLTISIKTVELHKAGIMERVGLRTTAELTKYALQHGITDDSK